MLREREKFEKLYRAIPLQALEERTRIVLEDYAKYYKEFDVPTIEPDPFHTWFCAFAHPKLSAESKATYKTLFEQIRKPLSPGMEEGLTERLVAVDTAYKAASILERFQEGDEINLGFVLKNLVEEHELNSNRKAKAAWVQVNMTDELGITENDIGYHWRLDEINEVMRPLWPGDFGIVAARPDVGKTTFLTDQGTHFAAQMEQLFPGEGRSLLWFNNEGVGKRIITRAYQSALNASYSQLVERMKKGTVDQEYWDATGGQDRIKVFDIHDYWNYDVEELIVQNKPGMIFFDMLDNIKFGGLANNNGQRTDQLLEAMYQWGRVIAVKYDCPVIATSQISADGENLCYPLLSMLKDSKTGKQGAADFIMTLGYQSANPEARYLGLTKNKLSREGGPKRLEKTVIFDGARGRYVSPKDMEAID